MTNYLEISSSCVLQIQAGDPRPCRWLLLCTAEGFVVSVMGYPTKHSFTAVRLPFARPSVSFIHKGIRRFWALRVCFCLSSGEGLLVRRSAFVRLATIGQSKEKFDLLIVEDIQLLPLAFELKGEGKILDAREYYPRQNEGELWFELFEKKRRGCNPAKTI